MVADSGVIGRDAAHLRVVAQRLRAIPQDEIVRAIVHWRDRWIENEYRNPWMSAAAAIADPFPFSHVQVSLAALLHSLNAQEIDALIESDGVRDRCGPPLVGHVIAGNTPLLAWTSILRAVLMRSASLVKLPSGPAAQWGILFLRTLAEDAPDIAKAIRLRQWTGGTDECDEGLAGCVDLLIVYGADATIARWRNLCSGRVACHDYGHRVSIGICGRELSAAAPGGFARDMLLYDQAGCLSLHALYCFGGLPDAVRLGEQMAGALAAAAQEYTAVARGPRIAAQVREERLLAHMDADTAVWESPGSLGAGDAEESQRWTVIARPLSRFKPAAACGILTVHPIKDMTDLKAALVPATGLLQGCAVDVAGSLPTTVLDIRRTIEPFGPSYYCRPGQLQVPPFSWRQDGRPVLASLSS